MIRSLAAALATVATLAVAPAAHAVPDCPDRPPAPVTLLSGQGLLEAMTAGQGALFVSASDQAAILRLDSRGAPPRTLAAVEEPGGLAFDADGTLVTGQGNGPAQGIAGNVTGLANLLRIDPDTGAQSVWATGLGMANGVTRGPDGSFYASNDFGTGIDRIAPDGTVTRDWARVESPNGLVVDREGRHLIVAQTFRPARIASVDLADPSKVTTFAEPGPADIAAGPDAITRGRDGDIYVAANGAGEVWRVDAATRSICALARGLGLPSAVSFGPGGDLPRRNLYAVTFSGDLVELPGVG